MGTARKMRLGRASMDRLDRAPTTPQLSATQTQPEAFNRIDSGAEVLKNVGVSDGIRTRDVQSHSLALYQAELRSPPQDIWLANS
jgi:hypothetical protein